MNYGFWGKLDRPFFALAPMVNVTDTVFRQIIIKYGRPDVFFTEFVSCDGLCSRGRPRLLRDLHFTPQEQPIVAQIFGATPANYYETAKLIVELGFDGIDINMGCPDRGIVRQGAGASLIRHPALAKEIIEATREGVSNAGRFIPISVKTRLGFNEDELDTWMAALLSMKLPALTVHGRTKKELSLVPARWDQIGEVVKMAKGTGTLIIGNGDVMSLAEAHEKVAQTGVDGVMMGRAIFGNPWLFNPNQPHSLVQTLLAMVDHATLFEETWGRAKNFELMKKYFKAYATGFEGAHELRMRLMECTNAHDVGREVGQFLKRD